MPRHVSYDERAERLSPSAPLPPAGKHLSMIRELMQEAPDVTQRYFEMLPWVDREICRLYFIEELTQVQISRLGEIDQSVVSGRLKSSISLLRLLMKRPTQNRNQLDEDLSALFPPELVEAALFFWVEFSPSRVKNLLRVSESGAANKLTSILECLEELAALPERGPHDPAALRRLGMVDADGAFLADDAVARRSQMAFSYLEYFRCVKKVGSRMSRSFRKDNYARANAFREGPSII